MNVVYWSVIFTIDQGREKNQGVIILLFPNTHKSTIKKVINNTHKGTTEKYL